MKEIEKQVQHIGRVSDCKAALRKFRLDWWEILDSEIPIGGVVCPSGIVLNKYPCHVQ